jgi:hypothetical protein
MTAASALGLAIGGDTAAAPGVEGVEGVHREGAVEAGPEPWSSGDKRDWWSGWPGRLSPIFNTPPHRTAQLHRVPERYSNMRSDGPAEWLPNICANGHRLTAPNVLVDWSPCSCAPGRTGYRTVTCRTCGAIWYRPPHTDDTKGAVDWK